MKRIITTLVAAAFIAIAPSAYADQAVVTLNATSSTTSDYIMLGDIAKISPSPLTDKNSAKIASTIIGRSPLPGLSRPLNKGDVRLKLRANGIDPTTIDIEGPDSIVVANGSAPAQGAQTAGASANGQGSSSATPAQSQKVIKFGDPLDVLVIDGPVIIHAKAYANQSGSVGDTIQVHRDGVDHLLVCTVIGAGQVQLEE